MFRSVHIYSVPIEKQITYCINIMQFPVISLEICTAPLWNSIRKYKRCIRNSHSSFRDCSTRVRRWFLLWCADGGVRMKGVSVHHEVQQQRADYNMYVCWEEPTFPLRSFISLRKLQVIDWQTTLVSYCQYSIPLFVKGVLASRWIQEKDVFTTHILHCINTKVL